VQLLPAVMAAGAAAAANADDTVCSSSSNRNAAENIMIPLLAILSCSPNESKHYLLVL
jgi:hypothetical protein